MRLPVQPHCRQLAVLLDPGGQIPSSISAPLRPETPVMTVLIALDGRNMGTRTRSAKFSARVVQSTDSLTLQGGKYRGVPTTSYLLDTVDMYDGERDSWDGGRENLHKVVDSLIWLSMPV